MESPEVGDETDLGALSIDTGRYDEALRWYTKALEAGSRQAVPLFGRGLAYQGMGKLGHAVQEYETACKMGYTPACDALHRTGPSPDGDELR